jgi:hypothetical protein
MSGGVDDHEDDGRGGGDPKEPGEKVIITDVVLTFMHSWFQGNNQQEIVKLAMSSFTPVQLAEATKLIMEKFPESGKYVAHRDSPGRSASEIFALDILKVFQFLDGKGREVVYSCDSMSMRTVKVSTMLFSDEEPIVAHKLALMEKTISDLLAGQKTLFTLVGEKLDSAKSSSTPSSSPPVVPSGPVTASSGQTLSFAETAARSLLGNSGISRNQFGQPKSKRINSLVSDVETFEQSDDDVWELSAEEKRREKLKKRYEEKRAQDELKRRNQIEEKKKPKFVVGTGAKLDNKDNDCPGQAAPKHVFVARTAMSTTKETVEGCLEYLAGIKGVATCCTPQERLDSGEAFSLSWRVQVDSSDLEKALLPTSWKSGWAVKPYFFRRKKPENQTDRSDGLARFLAQHGQMGLLRQNLRP